MGLIVVFLVLWIGPAIWAGNIAEQKGRSKAGFIALTLGIGWIGLLIAAVVKPDYQVAAPPGRRPCPHCAELIQEAATVCRFCSRDVEPVPPPMQPRDSVTFHPDAKGLMCPKGHENAVTARRCFCGSKHLAPF